MTPETFLILLFITCFGIISLTELFYGFVRKWLRNRKNQSHQTSSTDLIGDTSRGNKSQENRVKMHPISYSPSPPLFILISTEGLLLLTLLLAQTTSLFFVWFGIGFIVLRRI